MITRVADHHRASLSVIVAILFITVLVGVAGGGRDALAQGKPLLIEGKQTLYQRILTYPGASIHAAAGDTTGTPVPAMSSFYVYERRNVAGADWLLVGAADDGITAGWIDGRQTVAWKQQLALAFTNPAQRDRTLIFRNQQDLEAVINAKDPGAAAGALRQRIAGGSTPDDFPVVAQEPETFIDIQHQFYLLPILDAKETMTGAGYEMRELHLASITGGVEAGKEPAAPSLSAPDTDNMLRNFSAAVVFVIDSTQSMGPYIDQTKKVVTGIYDQIQKQDTGATVKFGLVAFRSKTKENTDIEYLTKVFVDPSQATGKDSFLESVKKLAPANASTARFSEDSYAGVVAALNDIDWSAFGGRYIVLITDAGALEGKDEYSSTGMNGEQVRLLAQERGVAIYTVHLLTPEGASNHKEAEAQYGALSKNSETSRPLLYPVEGGNVDQFGKVIGVLSQAIVEQVKTANAGGLSPAGVQTAPASTDDATRIKSDVAAVGYAMQLAYLGRLAKTTTPEFVDAWASDRDFAKPDVATMDVRVLLTKRQLSDLQQVLRTVLDVGKTKQLDPAGFFDAIRSAAATVSRDPTKLKDPNAVRLGDLGLLDEYLSDLPYKSKVMSIDQDIWQSWSISEQQYFLDEIERKLAMYQQFNDDVDSWVKLAPNAPASEAVYPVPLDAMP
jgi:hypothetical protein